MKDYINSKAEIFFGDAFFKKECLPSDFDYRVHKKEPSPYFDEKGFKVSMMYNDYYSRLSGYVSDKYLSMDLYYFYIVPALNRRQFSRAYADKNLYDNIFVGINQPESIIKNRNGLLYDAVGRRINIEKAIDICWERREERMIIKPSIDSGEGRGVSLLACNDYEILKKQILTMPRDYIVQACVNQHDDMSRLNKSSLNTLRMLTYRDVSGKVRHLRDKTIMRVGNPGSVRDNVGAGGGMCQVFDNGKVNDRVVHYKSLNVESFEAKHGIKNFSVPSFDKAILFVEELHDRLPYFDLVAWDIAIDYRGEPLLVEYNLPGECGVTQQGAGPMFEDELDEIIARASNVRRIIVSNSVNVFKSGFDYALQMSGEEYGL